MSALLAGGMSLPSLMRILGHRDHRMTLRYAAITDDLVVKEYNDTLAKLADRYHAHVLRTPTEVARAVRYLSENARKHAAPYAATTGETYSPGNVDPYSSAANPACVRDAITWLLCEGRKRTARPAESWRSVERGRGGERGSPWQPLGPDAGQGAIAKAFIGAPRGHRPGAPAVFL